MAFCCATKAAAKPLAPRACLGVAFGFHLVVRVSVIVGSGQLAPPPRLLVGLARALHPLAQPRLLLLPRLLLQLESRRELPPLRAHLLALLGELELLLLGELAPRLGVPGQGEGEG